MTSRRTLLIAAGGVAAVVAVAAGIKWGPRFVSAGSRLIKYASMPVYDGPVVSDGTLTNVIFLHHSTGHALIQEGNVRPLLTDLGYQFWDHGYNHAGLVAPDGTVLDAHYNIPGMRGRGDTDVPGLAKLFSQPVTDPPTNAFSRLMQHEVLIVKSCFPNSAISSDAMQAEYQKWYLQMRDVMDQHRDHVFIIVTSPPLHPMETRPDEARRARAIADWLTSDAFLEGHDNVFVFDFFDLLADPTTGMLREAYRRPGEPNSHPNRQANETIGPLFVAFVDEVVRGYRSANE